MLFLTTDRDRMKKTSNYFRRNFSEYTEGLIQSQEIGGINVFKSGTVNLGLSQHLLFSPAATVMARSHRFYL